jgi:hypothetical protein
LKVFPNPTVNEASISSSEMMKSIQVTSENGQLITHFQQLDTQFYQLNLSGLSGGIYFIIVDFYSGWKEVLQLVKQ